MTAFRAARFKALANGRSEDLVVHDVEGNRHILALLLDRESYAPQARQNQQLSHGVGAGSYLECCNFHDNPPDGPYTVCASGQNGKNIDCYRVALQHGIAIKGSEVDQLKLIVESCESDSIDDAHGLVTDIQQQLPRKRAFLAPDPNAVLQHPLRSHFIGTLQLDMDQSAGLEHGQQVDARIPHLWQLHIEPCLHPPGSCKIVQHLRAAFGDERFQRDVAVLGPFQGKVVPGDGKKSQNYVRSAPDGILPKRSDPMETGPAYTLLACYLFVEAVAPLPDQVRETIARYRMLTPGLRLGVAVSGGADSVCLLHVVLQLRSEFNLSLAVIHIDHNLRGPQSQADAQFVHNLAQQLGLPFHIRRLSLDREVGNLEQEGRRARYQFFRDLVQEGAVEKVALGHTRSDQAETVLFRFLRGSGSEGLAGIRPVTDSGIVRPLIQVTRPQVEHWLQECNIPWRDDETNTDTRFDRNRIRHQLIPQLQSEWNPALGETLAQMADWAFEEELYWRSEVARLAANWVRFADNAAVIDASRLTALPVAAARHLVRHIVKQMKGDLLGIGFGHIEAVRKLARRAEGSGRLQIPGVEVCRSLDWVRFAKKDTSGRASDWEVYLSVPGKYVVPPAVPLTTIELELVRNNGVYNRRVNALDWERAGEYAQGVAGSLVLRNWRPGDQYQREGQPGPERLKILFQEHRVPLWERRNWPIITVGGIIAWARRFGPAEQFAVRDVSRTVLSIREDGIDGGMSYV